MRNAGNAKIEGAKFMEYALKLAQKGNPSPNPYVGAVIVKDGLVIGSGFHKKVGMDHAEIEALKSLKNPDDAKGATIYVNLEPCNHYGRTPPCTKSIIESGITKVVFAMDDPNPDVSGEGSKKLQHNGILVERGLLEQDAKKLNEVFIKYSKTRMPFVVLKAAMSLDGKIATKSGDSKWITGEKSRKYAHKLRSRYDAILVGINTVVKDNPMLTARIRNGKNPTRVVLDSQLKIPMNANVLNDPNVIIAASEKCDRKKMELLTEKGAEVILCGKENVDLHDLLRKLGEKEITSLLVEGGGKVQGSFTDGRLVDKFVLFYAPKIIGGKNAKCAVGGSGADNMDDVLKLKVERIVRLGEDILVEAYPK